MVTILLCSFFTILTFWIAGIIYCFRKQLSVMVGMMAAVALGMAVGLAIGTIVTQWLPGKFFQSTILSMMIGGTVGAIVGGPISLMAVLDGLLSGVMGGMMGTMLMVMMPVPYIEITVNIISVLCSGIIFLLYVMLLGEIKPNRLRQSLFLLSKSVLMFLLIGLVLVFAQIDFMKTSSRLPFDQKHAHLGHNHDHTFDTELLVRAMEYSFNQTSIQIGLDQKVKITLDNTGQLEHDFEIVGTNIHIHAAPGKKNSLVVSFDKAGYYQVICTLPGHKESGMTASIQVTK